MISGNKKYLSVQSGKQKTVVIYGLKFQKKANEGHRFNTHFEQKKTVQNC